MSLTNSQVCQFVVKFEGLSIDNHSYKLVKLPINNPNTDSSLSENVPEAPNSSNRFIASELDEGIEGLD